MTQHHSAESGLTIERRTIDVIPDDERHGTPRNQFTLWFGANMQITAIVDGALAVVFGADALWAIVGLLMLMNGISPFVTNIVYDMTGSYRPALLLFIPLSLASALLFLTLGRYPSDRPSDSAISAR